MDSPNEPEMNKQLRSIMNRIDRELRACEEHTVRLGKLLEHEEQKAFDAKTALATKKTEMLNLDKTLDTYISAFRSEHRL